MADGTLMVDFDYTTHCLRLWQGARLVGELSPDVLATPRSEARDTRWTGWVSSEAVVELFGTYQLVTPEPVDG
jgi:hypothetical protein